MRYILLSAILLLSFASCEKAETPASREDELRSGKWKLVAGTAKWDPAIGLDTLVNYYNALPDCDKDDYLVFGTNFQGSQFSDGKCDPSEPDEVQFMWELYDNGTGIHFWYANETFFEQSAVSAPFVSYTSQRFTIRHTEYRPNPVDSHQRDTITFTHTFGKF